MIVIIDYGAGNVRSVQNAIERLGYETIVSSDSREIEKAEKVIFPGVGAAKEAIKQLEQKDLIDCIVALKQPVLGICLGMQLLCKKTEEGNVNGLGVFDNEVKLFPKTDLVPQMGWNSLKNEGSTLLQGVSLEEDVYFVHSYYATLGEDTKAVCDYIQPFSAVLEKDNFYATQFHPEKSGEVGVKILNNFLKL